MTLCVLKPRLSQVAHHSAPRIRRLEHLHQGAHALFPHGNRRYSRSRMSPIAIPCLRNLTGLANAVLALEWNSVAPVASAIDTIECSGDASTGHDGDAPVGCLDHAGNLANAASCIRRAA